MSSLDKMNTVIELMEFAEFQAKRRFLEKNKDATEAEIEAFLKSWYRDKPPLREDVYVRVRKDHGFD